MIYGEWLGVYYDRLRLLRLRLGVSKLVGCNVGGRSECWRHVV